VGISYVQGIVRGPTGVEATVRFLIDSGATYSLLPEQAWHAIALAPKRKVEFVLADGTTVHRAVSECHLSLSQGEGHTPVVLGQPGDAEPLLGVVTLEILGLVFRPLPPDAPSDAEPAGVGLFGAGISSLTSPPTPTAFPG